MNEIFTYPNNAGTSYIDPLYVGSAADGFQKRIQDLKDGNYKAWDGTAPADTVNELMSNISKFATNYYDNIGDNNITINDMYEYPLLTGTVTLDPNDITANITSISAPDNTPAILTSANHGLSDLDPVILSNSFAPFLTGPSPEFSFETSPRFWQTTMPISRPLKPWCLIIER